MSLVSSASFSFSLCFPNPHPYPHLLDSVDFFVPVIVFERCRRPFFPGFSSAGSSLGTSSYFSESVTKVRLSTEAVMEDEVDLEAVEDLEADEKETLEC